MRRNSRGVALILVLMVTGALGLLMLQFGLTAREQTARAQQLLDRANADLKLRSVNSQILFDLATHTWEANPEFPERDSFVQRWSFGGKGFGEPGVDIAIQDLSGLIPLPQPGESTAVFQRTLEVIGIAPQRAADLAARMRSVQASVDATPLQDLSELGPLLGLTGAEISQLRMLTSLYPPPGFNPGTAPLQSLEVRFGGSVLNGLRDLRNEGRLDERNFFQVAGSLADEFTSFYPGPGFRITTRISLGDVTAAEELTLSVDPYHSDPFVIWSRRRPSSAGGAP